MADDSDVDDEKHDEMLRRVTGSKISKHGKSKRAEVISAVDLLNAIKSTKNVSKARASLVPEKRKEKANVAKTLPTPLHRTEAEKIERVIGFDELKKDLAVWDPIVRDQRSAEQLSFPLNRDKFLLESAADRSDGFVPRTSLEKAMQEVIASSKCVLSNSKMYTDAEMELLKAVNVKEAKERLGKLQKMRALQSYQEAKFRRQKKIKSKTYHRLKKRAERRKQLKEFEELLARDPEAAKEKMEEIERDRIAERATLKHRSQNKFSKVVLRHASKNKEMMRVMEDHIRFGREMKEKINLQKDGGESSDDGKESEDEAVGPVEDELPSYMNVDISALGEQEGSSESEEIAQMDHTVAPKKKRRIVHKKASKDNAGESCMNLDIRAAKKDPSVWKQVVDSDSRQATEKKGRRRRSSKVIEAEEEKKDQKEPETTKDIDDLFEDVHRKISEKAAIVAKNSVETAKNEKASTTKRPRRKRKGAKKDEEEETKSLPMLDPNNYLKVTTSTMNQVAPDMTEGNEMLEQDEVTAMAEAFADDDVIVEFAEEKEEAEEAEKEKDMNLALLGWGDWAGPGIDMERARKKKERFVLKAKEKVRKDKGRMGVIISEKNDQAIVALQPRTVPFPFTRAKDFEANLAQPIGKEWNSVGTHRKLVTPSVVTQGGRAILPMSKKDVLKSRFDYEE